jgi:hypothetical protein
VSCRSLYVCLLKWFLPKDLYTYNLLWFVYHTILRTLITVTFLTSFVFQAMYTAMKQGRSNTFIFQTFGATYTADAPFPSLVLRDITKTDSENIEPFKSYSRPTDRHTRHSHKGVSPLNNGTDIWYF